MQCPNDPVLNYLWGYLWGKNTISIAYQHVVNAMEMVAEAFQLPLKTRNISGRFVSQVFEESDGTAILFRLVRDAGIFSL
jgi:hypothetical protein